MARLESRALSSTLTVKSKTPAMVLLPASIAVLAASQWREIARYIKISQMSRGGGHPQIVPAAGQHSYPTRPGGGDADGTGDFDSASRGGPAPA